MNKNIPKNIISLFLRRVHNRVGERGGGRKRHEVLGTLKGLDWGKGGVRGGEEEREKKRGLTWSFNGDPPLEERKEKEKEKEKEKLVMIPSDT